MFKKLYRNLLVLNLSVLSLLLIVIFTSLYLSTYSEIQGNIDFQLDTMGQPDVGTGQTPPPLNQEDFKPERLGSFIILFDNSGDVSEVISHIAYSDAFINNLILEATNADGKINYDDEVWSYKKQSVNGIDSIAFVNTTSESQILSNTLTTYIIIFLISIGITAIISSLLTRKAITPVKESFDKQKQFVSDASHELKTPLTVINTNVDILLSEDKTDNKWLKYIKSEVTRMSKLTHDLLYLSNMTELEKNQIMKTQINASEKIESAVLGIEALAYENDLSLNYDIQPNIDIIFNGEQLHQLVMILVDNAIKYTNKKGTITISLEEQNNNVYFKVKNTGKGISEEDLKHIFDRFYKVDESRETKSNSFGLGLPIAKSICDNNHAKLSVTSEINEYTEFILKTKTAN